MNRILFAAKEFLPAALILIPLYWLLNKFKFHSGRKTALCWLFSCYLAAVYVLVGMPSVTYIRLELNLNIIPFLGMIDDLKNSILNVLLFVPLGLMLPMLWEKYRVKRNAVLFGFGLSLCIELAQIFTFRATDVNDLITNTLGTFLGCCAADLLPGPISGREKAGEAYLVCGITFAVMFFINPLFL